jgi:hypothetical protein
MGFLDIFVGSSTEEKVTKRFDKMSDPIEKKIQKIGWLRYILAGVFFLFTIWFISKII